VFPVAVPEFVMRAYSNEREIVYEPFAGSATSIIAERAGRLCPPLAPSNSTPVTGRNHPGV
jgi:DNA modification methylase